LTPETAGSGSGTPAPDQTLAELAEQVRRAIVRHGILAYGHPVHLFGGRYRYDATAGSHSRYIDGIY